MLTTSAETYALAAYVQGAIAAYGKPVDALSGATMALITEEAVAYVNAYLVVVSQATIHATTYRAGFFRTEARLAVQQ